MSKTKAEMLLALALILRSTSYLFSKFGLSELNLLHYWLSAF